VSTERYSKPDIAGKNAYDPMKEPRYTEIATFMRAPLATTLESVDIGLIGVPTDLGVTNRPGARHGPREIRNASSLMRAFNLGLGVNPYELCRIADLGDVRLSHRYDLERQNDDIEAFYRKVKAAGVIPISAGGDHSITYPYSGQLLPRRRLAWCISTLTPTHGVSSMDQSSLTVRLFVWPLKPACWTPNARSRSAFAAAKLHGWHRVLPLAWHARGFH